MLEKNEKKITNDNNEFQISSQTLISIKAWNLEPACTALNVF